MRSLKTKKTPKATLENLVQDANRIVRATAKESLENWYGRSQPTA